MRNTAREVFRLNHDGSPAAVLSHRKKKKHPVSRVNHFNSTEIVNTSRKLV
jgi:hypothetical protein